MAQLSARKLNLGKIARNVMFGDCMSGKTEHVTSCDEAGAARTRPSPESIIVAMNLVVMVSFSMAGIG